MQFHDIELTGSLDISGSLTVDNSGNITAPASSTASFGAIKVLGFAGNNDNLVDFSSSIASRVGSTEAGGVTSVTAGTGLTGGGASGALTVNVIGGTGITANADDIAVDFSDATLQSNVSGAFVAASASIATDIDALQAASGGFSTRLTTAEDELAETLVSASAQLASNVSGAFAAPSASIATDIDALQARVTTEEGNVDTLQARDIIAGTGLTGGGTLAADRTLNVVGGTGITANANDIEVDFSDSTLQSNVSGAFVAASSSIATEINALQAQGGTEFTVGDSGSISSRLTTAEDELAETLVSASAQLAANVSGAFVAPSASIATDIDALQAASGGFSTRISAEEANVDALQARDIIAGTGLTGGGTLAADRTLNVVGGTGITANANDIEVDFSDSTLQSNVSGAFAAASSSIATEINDLQAAGFTSTDSASLSTRITAAEDELENTLVSQSAQIASEVSGAFAASSGSIATDINALQTDSGSFSTRLTAAESELGNTLISGSAQIASNISGSLGANAAVIRTLTRAAISGSVSATAIAALDAGIISSSGDTVDLNGKKIEFANVYSTEGDLPSATDNHGMFAHVHGTGLAYFAHAGNWVKLALYSGNVSSSAQIASNISGSFGAASQSIATEINALQAQGGTEFTVGDSGSISSRLTTAESELAETLVSASAQLASNVSGAFVAPSSSIATEINALQADSGSFSTRITTAESELSNTLVSASAQLAANVSGAFVAPSSSIATEINALQADSGSFSTRIAAAESELGNTLISGSAQIASDISGSTGALSGSLSTRFDAIEDARVAVVVTISTPASTWTCAHNLNTQYPTVTVWDNSNQMIIPQTVTATSSNVTTITFSENVSGKASFTFGAGSASGSAGTAEITSGSTQPAFILNGHFNPSAHNQFDLGSPTKFWRDLYLSSGSLYIDGQKVLHSDSSELIIETTAGQSMKILESGADDITLQTANGDIKLTNGSGAGNIELDSPVQVTAGNKVMSSDGNNIHFGDGLSISGSISLTGVVDGIDLQAYSASVSTRLTSGGGGSSFTASGISGSFVAPSASIATDIDALQARMTTEEGNVDTLQARDIIAGTGLTGGGTLAADRTLNVVGGTGITANANDIEVDFSDSTLQSTISGSLSAAAVRALGAGILSGSILTSSITNFPSEVSRSAAAAGFGAGGGGGGGSSIFTSGAGISQKTLADIIVTGSIEINPSGSAGGNTLFAANGANGSILSLVDDSSATLFSVAGNTGLPVFEVSSSGRIDMGPFGNKVVIDGDVSGSSTSTGSFAKLLVGGNEMVATTANSIAALGAGIISGSAQIASDISGSISAASVTSAGALMDSEVSSLALVKALTGAGISGSFTAPSSSIATEINALQTDSASFSTRVAAVESGGGGGGGTGIFVATGSFQSVTDDLQVTGSLVAKSTGSDSTIFAAVGTSEEMLTITDSLSGSLFSVVRNSGIPVMEVFSDGNVDMHNLPTSDPGVPGRLYNDSGTLKISL